MLIALDEHEGYRGEKGKDVSGLSEWNIFLLLMPVLDVDGKEKETKNNTYKNSI